MYYYHGSRHMVQDIFEFGLLSVGIDYRYYRFFHVFHDFVHLLGTLNRSKLNNFILMATENEILNMKYEIYNNEMIKILKSKSTFLLNK